MACHLHAQRLAFATSTRLLSRLSVTGYSMQRQTDPSLSNNLRKKVLLLALPNPAMRCAVRQGMLAASDLPLMEKLGQLAFLGGASHLGLFLSPEQLLLPHWRTE